MFPVLGHQQFKVQLYFAKTFNLVTFTTYIFVYMPQRNSLGFTHIKRVYFLSLNVREVGHGGV